MNWSKFREVILPCVIGAVIGAFVIYHSPNQRKKFAWLFPPPASPTKIEPARMSSSSAENPRAQNPPVQQLQILLLTPQKANALLHAGKYEELTVRLERDRRFAKGRDLERIDRMLSGLKSLRASTLD